MAICRDCGAEIRFAEAATAEGKVYWKRLDRDGSKHSCKITKQTTSQTLSTLLPAAPPDDGWKGDKWDQLANQHLLGYVIKRMRVTKYGPRSTAILLEHKSAWATQMREYAADNAIPADQGRAEWGGCMSRAEEQIAHERAAAKAQKTQAA